MRKIIKKVVFLTMLFLLVFFIQNGVYENLHIDKMLSDFISNGVFVEEVNFGSEAKPLLARYYKVPRGTSLDTERPSIQMLGSKRYVGSNGDIFVTKNSPFPYLPGVDQFIRYFWGGHAGIVYSLENQSVATHAVEAFGDSEDPRDNGVKAYMNVWHDTTYDVVGVRLKNATKEDYQKIVDNAKDKVGSPYNFTFILNRDSSYYCSDLVSQSIEEHNQDLSINDGFVVTVNDIILSENTYIFYYHFYYDNIKYVYYMGE